MVTVKRIAGGVFSNWVGDSSRPATSIDVMPPHGSFTTEFEPAAAGRCRHRRRFRDHAGHLADPDRAQIEPGSRFTLLYGNRDSSSIIFLEALAA